MKLPKQNTDMMIGESFSTQVRLAVVNCNVHGIAQLKKNPPLLNQLPYLSHNAEQQYKMEQLAWTATTL